MNFITRWLESRRENRETARMIKEHDESMSVADRAIEEIKQKIRDAGGDPDNPPPRNELADFCRDRAEYYKSKM